MPQTDPDDETLHLRPTRINGESFADDYQVLWQDLPIGRILKQDGVPSGRRGGSASTSMAGRSRQITVEPARR
jgi:hypothetical protein